MVKGHTITSDFSDDSDIKRHYRYLCAKGNMLKSKFVNCTDEVKIQLFRSYCASLYGGSLWSKFTLQTMNRLRVVYNNAFRFLMRYPRYCSASEMFAINRLKSFQEVRRTVNYSLYRRCTTSKNSLITSILRSDCIKCSKIQREWIKTLFI